MIIPVLGCECLVGVLLIRPFRYLGPTHRVFNLLNAAESILMVSCMYIFHHRTLRFEGNKYIIIIISMFSVSGALLSCTLLILAGTRCIAFVTNNYECQKFTWNH